MSNMMYDDYLDKVYGGWFGKCLGGAAGAPVEGVKGTVTASMREILNPDLPNDDLDLQLLWLEILEKKGPYLTARDLAKGWEAQCWYPFGEYGYFLKNFERGIDPPLSGSFNNHYFHDGMGCPIRSEIWAMVHPGRPAEAVKLAKYDASLDHTGNSYWAEVFLAALESMAFYKQDMGTLIEEALKYVEEDCRFRNCVEMILESYHRQESFESIIRKIQMDYSHPDFTNSVQNMGYIILALLFGGKDLEKVINTALKCGYDADCTCATAGAVVGIMNGYRAIPEDLKVLLQDRFVCGIDVKRPDDRIITLAKDTCRVGAGMARVYGDTSVETPGSLDVPVWENTQYGLTIEKIYTGKPSIGFDDCCTMKFKCSNHSSVGISGRICFGDLPEGWQIAMDQNTCGIGPGESSEVTVRFFTTENVDRINQKNKIRILITGDDNKILAQDEFGIPGGIRWKAYGPYIEPREFVSEEGIPPCHGAESALPVVETMFSNMALPEREYLDEKMLIRDAEQIPYERVITAYEDLIPVDESYGIYGEATFYLVSDLWFEKDCHSWIVVGNNDAYKIWINGELIQSFDEARTWQPQCHGSVVPFQAGKNRVILKLTRRTKSLMFSFGIRGHEGQHYHSQKWITDFACMK